MLLMVMNILIPRSKNENSSVLPFLNVSAQHHSKAGAFTLQGAYVLGKEYVLCPANVVSWD